MNESPLNSALRHFEATEANLRKLEAILSEIEEAIPQGIVFEENLDYENNCRSFESILSVLPKIDGWKPDIVLMDLDGIAQSRMDSREVGDFECIVSTERQIEEPGRLLREYRYRFNQKRRELIRDSLVEIIDQVDNDLRILSKEIEESESNELVSSPEFEQLKEHIAQIDTLLGSSVTRPPRWGDLHRHMHFGLLGDLSDIITHDWPNVKSGLRKTLYGGKEPIPIEIEDLSLIVVNKPKGPVATKLAWDNLTDDEFERLIFSLISSEKEYENPEWLMKTNAPDRGRDLSVYRVHKDPLSGTIRRRVIIQCKHWRSKSVAPANVTVLRDQMKLWEPPRVDIHIIATSGRFTSDAVAIIDNHNQSDSGLTIEMWPESHLERLLASRPGVIADFGLR